MLDEIKIIKTIQEYNEIRAKEWDVVSNNHGKEFFNDPKPIKFLGLIASEKTAHFQVGEKVIEFHPDINLELFQETLEGWAPLPERTQEEIENLKLIWREDFTEVSYPSWNLEEATGYYAHRKELKEYRLKYENRQKKIQAARDSAKASHEAAVAEENKKRAIEHGVTPKEYKEANNAASVAHEKFRASKDVIIEAFYMAARGEALNPEDAKDISDALRGLFEAAVLKAKSDRILGK